MSRFLWKLGGARLPLVSTVESIPPVKEVAHSLSIINRFTGWTIYPYPVAQHAVFTSYLVEPAFAMHALHHDDHECVSGDISSPMKRELNSTTLSTICSLFDEHSPYCDNWDKQAKQAVARADLLATYFEAIHLVQVPREEVGAHFGRQELTADEICRLSFAAYGGDNALDGSLSYMLREMHWSAARQLYINRHKEIEAAR